MIGEQRLMTGVLAGAFLIVFGIVPGLFPALADGVRNSLNLLSSQCPAPSRLHQEFPRPRWLAGLGAALITATVLAYLDT